MSRDEASRQIRNDKMSAGANSNLSSGNGNKTLEQPVQQLANCDDRVLRVRLSRNFIPDFMRALNAPTRDDEVTEEDNTGFFGVAKDGELQTEQQLQQKVGELASQQQELEELFFQPIVVDVEPQKQPTMPPDRVEEISGKVHMNRKSQPLDDVPLLCRLQSQNHHGVIHRNDIEGTSKANPLDSVLNKLLDVLEAKDPSDIFREPVSTEQAPYYLEIVKQPMDLGTMRAKLRQGQYTRLEHLEVDFYLMIQNCLWFNNKDTVFYRAGIRLRDQAVPLFMQVRKELERESLLDNNSSEQADHAEVEVENELRQLLIASPCEETVQKMLRLVDKSRVLKNLAYRMRKAIQKSPTAARNSALGAHSHTEEDDDDTDAAAGTTATVAHEAERQRERDQESDRELLQQSQLLQQPGLLQQPPQLAAPAQDQQLQEQMQNLQRQKEQLQLIQQQKEQRKEQEKMQKMQQLEKQQTAEMQPALEHLRRLQKQYYEVLEQQNGVLEYLQQLQQHHQQQKRELLRS